MIESITKEPLTTGEDQSRRRASRYHLDEVNRGAGLPPALLVTGEARRDEGRDRPEPNPVLIAPAANGTYIGVYSGSESLEHADVPGLCELLAAAGKADAGDREGEEEDDLKEIFLPPLDESSPRVLASRFGLFEYFGLADAVSRGLGAGWTGPADREQAPEGLRQWVHKRTSQAINARLHSYYRQTLERLQKSHPTVVAVQRSVFAATFGVLWPLLDPRLYERTYLVRDLTSYRAAGAALAYPPYYRRNEDLYDRLDNGGWRGVFSPDGDGYRALNRTLVGVTQLVGGIVG